VGRVTATITGSFTDPITRSEFTNARLSHGTRKGEELVDVVLMQLPTDAPARWSALKLLLGHLGREYLEVQDELAAEKGGK
jgi:hypothetical protein